ncbi:hypothetical protein [Streptomyces apocyni]|uniref:hypothetical protein n=1 Tax=Streptomyces apocyni TaxID=2654677 RepID=UPI0012EA0BEC|nr:hypothetical protein [Streptomyces apocyni]
MTTTREREEQMILGLFEKVERVEDTARRVPQPDLRDDLLKEIRNLIAQAGPVRAGIAASLLSISERTVRTWTDEGLLAPVATKPRLLLDPERLHTVLHLVKDLRAAGRDRNLLDAVWAKLQDQALLDRHDLADSLDQMRRIEGRVVRPRPDGQEGG